MIILLKALSAMATAFDSFDGSALGAFTRSPCLSRNFAPTAKLVALSAGGGFDYVMSSGNATAWTKRTPNAHSDFRSVCYSPSQSRYVAVGRQRSSGGSGVESSDDGGVTWITRTPAGLHDWRSICWSPELSMYVAVAEDSTGLLSAAVMYSYDAETWTLGTGAGGTGVPRTALCWSASRSLFCAIGSSTLNNLNIVTTWDGNPGNAWIAHDGPTSGGAFAGGFYESVCWVDSIGLFVAVGAGILSSQYVLTSPDTVTWTAQAASAAVHWRSIDYSPELALLVAVASTGHVMYSSDAVIWTAGTPASLDSWWAVRWSPLLGLFIAVAQGGATYGVMTWDGNPAHAWIGYASSDDNSQWSCLATSA